MRKWIVTLGGAGLLPLGPGTWGSLVTAAALLLAYIGMGRAVGGVSPLAWTAALVAGVVLFAALCVALGGWAVQHFGRDDPGPCVIDEAAGICLTMIGQPLLPGWREGWVVLAAFVAFRVFDITKPPPARQLEALPGGWGILLDDLMAAVYANLLCQLVLRAALRY